jgi:hypothetical protein
MSTYFYKVHVKIDNGKMEYLKIKTLEFGHKKGGF